MSYQKVEIFFSFWRYLVWERLRSIGFEVKTVDEDGDLCNFGFSLTELPDQRGKTVKDEIFRIIDTHNLSHEKLVAVTFDSCPAMKLTQRLINDTIDDYFYNKKIHNIIEENEPAEFEESLKITNIFMCNCFIHLIQLVIKHSINENYEIRMLVDDFILITKCIGSIKIKQKKD